MSTSPFKHVESEDNTHMFFCLCTYISICENKKLNLSNVLLLILKNQKYKDLFMSRLEMETEYELVKLFLHHDPFLYKSKYITRYCRTINK